MAIEPELAVVRCLLITEGGWIASLGSRIIGNCLHNFLDSFPE